MGRDGDPPTAPDLHAGGALIPPGDDLPLTERELEAVAAVPRRVELLAVAPGHADVVDVDVVAGLRLGTFALDEVLDHEVGGRIAGGDRDLGLVVCHGGTVPPSR